MQHSHKLVIILLGTWLSYVVVWQVNALTLAYSGTSSLITYPGSVRGASYAVHNYGVGIGSAPEAAWIWDESGGSGDCAMDLNIKHSFGLKCLNQPLTVYITADNVYSFSLNSASASGGNWQAVDSYSVSTAGYSCGTVI